LISSALGPVAGAGAGDAAAAADAELGEDTFEMRAYGRDFDA